VILLAPLGALAKVDGLAVHIDALGTLAGRLGRLGARRREPEHP
jgi:hypothetical protein